jgi:phage repressor protein C with HTH and peptisase S24 domain
VKHVLNLDAANLVLIRIVTNNMAPWATDGDLVIIDISQTAIVADSPYILQYGDVLVPKRLVCQNDGTIVAKSDSQYCDDEVYPSDIKPPRILGRIIRRVVR